MAIDKDNDIASIRARLEELDTERNALAERLERLRSRQAPEQPSGVVGASRNLVALHGGLAAGERRAAQAGLQPDGKAERLVLATGRYLGEGFDDARLDTLFLVMPISWKGTLAQYVGRLHRDHDGKQEVVVYDYVDRAVPVLARMAAKREKEYKALGYVLES